MLKVIPGAKSHGRKKNIFLKYLRFQTITLKSCYIILCLCMYQICLGDQTFPGDYVKDAVYYIQGMDQERVRLTREEDLYKQEMLRLETDLGDLESTVEELRGNVINRKTRVNMSDVENMALILSKSSKTVADLKLR